MSDTGNIKGVDYNKFRAQRTETRKLTEKSINSLNISANDKKTLLSAYLSGILDFGDDGLTESEARELQSDIKQAQGNGDNENNPLSIILKNIAQYKQRQQTKTMYIVQAGDTPESIAKKLCENTQKASNPDYNAVLGQIKQHMNGSKWLMVGEMISIDGDFTDSIQVMTNNNKYKNSSSELVKDYKEKTEPKEEEKPTEVAEEDTVSNEKAEAQIQTAKTLASKLASSRNAKLFQDNIRAVTKENAAFVAQIFEKQTGNSIIRAGLLKFVDMAFLKNNFCNKLVMRAKELNITGVYFRELNEAKTPDQLIEWVKKASEKIIEAEKKANPALYNKYQEALANTNTQQEIAGSGHTEDRDSIRDYSPKDVEPAQRTPKTPTPQTPSKQVPVEQNPEVPVSQGKIVGDKVGGPEQISFTVPKKKDSTIDSPQKNIADAYTEAEKIAENIKEALKAFKNDNSRENIAKLKKELAKINKLNAAKILNEIPDLARQIIDVDFWGFGLDKSDVDNYLLKPLIERAKDLGIQYENIIGKINNNLDMLDAVDKLKREVYIKDVAKVNKYNKDQDDYRNYTFRYNRAVTAFTDMNTHFGNLITNENSPSVQRTNKKSKAGLYAMINFGDNKTIEVTTNDKNEITQLKMLDYQNKDSAVIYTPYMARYAMANGDYENGNIVVHKKSEKNPLGEYDFTKICQCVYKVLPELKPKTNQA